MSDESQFSLGYRPDLEDRDGLVATATPFALPDQPATFSAPASISHRSWRKPPKNQGQVGRCSGASRSSGEEVLNWISTGGQAVRFSMDYAYIENQIACGLLGSDAGATIMGSLKASETTGIVLESVQPQQSGYTTKIAPGAEAIGKQHLIKSHVIIQGYDDALKWLQTGNGVILIGISWTGGLSQSGKRITRQSMGGRAGGGHALLLEGYDTNGDLDMENSWGTQWGDGGWAMVAPEVVDYWGKNGDTLIGISDLQSYGYRKLGSWSEMF